MPEVTNELGTLQLPGPIHSRSVAIMRDTVVVYPELYLEVHIPGPEHEKAGFAHMFARARCQKAKSLDKADLVVFTGGVDVDPALYGEKAHPKTYFSKSRDDADIKTFLECVEKGIPMLGVCRGAQFLHVMNGGKLYQHVDGHLGEHAIFDLKTQARIDKVSSVHHQMVIENRAGGMELIAVGGSSKNRWRNDTVCETTTKSDVEVFYYPETLCLGVQGHPEYAGYAYFTKYVLDLLMDYVVMNLDLDWDGGCRRMKPDVLAQRRSGFGK